MIDAAYFLEKAELCFRLSKADGVSVELAAELSELGYDLMAKAVYLDTITKRASVPREPTATAPASAARP